MTDKPKEFERPDPLDESISGTIGTTGEYIQESTAIPESSYLLQESPSAHGPQVVGDDDDASEVPESVSVDQADLPEKGTKKLSLPLLAGVGVTALLVGYVVLKGVSGSPAVAPTPASQAQPAAVAAVPAPPAVTTTTVNTSQPDASASAPQAVVSAAQAAASEPAAAVTSPIAASAAAPVDLYSIKNMPAPAAVPSVPAVAVAPATTATTATATTGAAPACAPVAVAACSAATRPPVTHRQASAVSKKTGGATTAKKPDAAPLPSVEGYEVHMGANGLAWLKLPSGDMRVVAKGDHIEGLGTVREIDAAAHLVRVGKVTLR